MNDHQLLSAYSAGDEGAFEILVEKYFRMVYTVAVRRTSDSHLAEEIAQSVFIILSRKAPGLSSKASIPGWLLRTTQFVCRDAIKMRARRAENERKLAMDLEHQTATNPHPTNLELLLEEAIQVLSPDEQASLVARFFEGKNFADIAEMFRISEEAARKRTSRCLAKIQAFMQKRGASISQQTLSGLLVIPPAHQAANQAMQSAIRTIHAAWQGNVAAGGAVALANHASRSLRWRFLVRSSLKVAVPAVLILFSAWTVTQWPRSLPTRIEKLGIEWAALDQRVAQHRQFLIQTPPTSPNYQVTVQQELGAISRESTHIISQLNPLLVAPDPRGRLAIFFTAELSKTLNLDATKKAALLSYVQNRLAQGATFNDALKAVGETTPTEAAEIKAMLSPEQRQRFDQVYGPDGVLLFSYAKAVGLGRIGA